MLSKLKGVLGLTKQENIGKGSSSQAFDVTFSDASLGLSLSASASNGMPEVVSVAVGSPAYSAGVRRGLLLTHLDGNAIESFEAFNAICGAVGRPVVLRFDSGQVSDAPRGLMTEEMKSNRREAMIKAAETRERAWGKRVATAAVARKKKEDFSDSHPSAQGDPTNPETLKKIAAIKRSEQHTAETLGYNPFKPIMSKGSSSEGARILVAKAPQPSRECGTDDSLLKESVECELKHVAAEIENLIMAEVESSSDSLFAPLDVSVQEAIRNGAEDGYFSQVQECFSLLLGVDDTSGPKDSLKSTAALTVCLSTAYKMLKNLNTQPDEPKFQSVRVLNTNFQSKVASYPGGLELMICSGFALSEDIASNTSTEESVNCSSMYLRHCGGSNVLARAMLRYMVIRVGLELDQLGIKISLN